MRYLIYDCEIIKCIPDRDGTRFDDYEYCDGWSDHANMGISCVGFAASNGDVCVCRWDDPGDKAWGLSLLNNADIIVGFNSRRFDDALMAANGVAVSTAYDLLEQVRIAAYDSPDWEDQPPGCSYALGAIGEANGFPKTGSGVLAPQLWQQGKHQEVIDYCLNDVKITKALLDLGLKGELIDPNTSQKLQLRPLDNGEG
ncbi:MAG: hypothetical protein F6K00_19455 [Leptolyngbya sp. SIOISBB]|nr:hypothetical protein [Leptolyngbya sp. SIOISBB]